MVGPNRDDQEPARRKGVLEDPEVEVVAEEPSSPFSTHRARALTFAPCQDAVRQNTAKDGT
jgi:hypothetical protein